MLSVPPQAAVVVGTLNFFNFFFIYNSGILRTTVSIFDVKDVILFFKVFFLMCTFQLFCEYTLYVMCVKRHD